MNNPATGKTDPVQAMFAQVPATYERVNHLLTLGLDLAWRRRLVRQAVTGAGAGRWADMCSGTGETAAHLVRRSPPGTEIVAVDFSPPMLDMARQKPEAARIKFVQADIRALPFPDGHFDLIVMSFAARNANRSRADFLRCLSEFRRTLKPGGRFLNLETSQPTRAWIRRLRDGYVRRFVPFIGGRISGAPDPYGYLSNTIPRFYSAEELAALMREAGFARVGFRRLMMGAAAIHEAVR